MKRKEFVVWSTLFCFILALGGGCGGGFKEVRRETKTIGEYFQAPDGSKVDPRVIQDAIQRKDWDTLARYSWVHNPEPVERVAGSQEALPIFFEDYGRAGEKYLRIGADPVVKNGWSDKDLPRGWFWVGLPGDAFATVNGKSKKTYSGLLRKGETVAVYVMARDGQPVVDSQRGILVQVGAVKRCANMVLSQIQIWVPVGVFKTVVSNKMMMLQKVVERETLVYLEKEDNWKWWLLAAGLAVGLGAGYALWHNSGGGGTCPTCPQPQPPPKRDEPKPPPPPPEVCPPVNQGGPGPAPRPSPQL